jgi:homocysteine S-methyltransferase
MRIAVELDPPAQNAQGDALEFLRDGALLLRDAGADFLTMADNPRAVARGDSVALASLVRALTGVPVVPHLACRDRNLLSIRSALTALDVAGIHEVLAVTGDPIRSEDKARVSSRAEFCAADLARSISEWNAEGEGFFAPFRVSAALNVNAPNFDAELRRAERKRSNGVVRFLTQPVLSSVAAANLAKAHRSLEAEIYGGILPIVGYRNAEFLSSGIRGIAVGPEILSRYRGLDKDRAAGLAVDLSLEIARGIRDSVDGYYLITPFRRLDVVARIIGEIRADGRAESADERAREPLTASA